MDTSEPAAPAGKGQGRRSKRELRPFSTRYLETLKPADAARWYWDLDARWLGFRVSPTGHKSWGLKYPCKIRRAQCRCSPGDFPALSLQGGAAQERVAYPPHPTGALPES